MNSGKSLRLLAMAHNFDENDIKYSVFKSSIDTRDKGVIHSRALGNKECTSVSEEDNIYDIFRKQAKESKVPIRYILVDEAQFLTEKQVEELCKISDKKLSDVICYGLKTDFQTKFFPGSKRLFELADELEEIKSYCKCGRKNAINARIDKDGNIMTNGEQVEVGGEEKYMPLCRKCYFRKISKHK